MAASGEVDAHTTKGATSYKKTSRKFARSGLIDQVDRDVFSLFIHSRSREDNEERCYVNFFNTYVEIMLFQTAGSGTGRDLLKEVCRNVKCIPITI